MGLETELIVRYFGKVQPLAMQAMRTLPHASVVIARSLAYKRVPASQHLSDAELLDQLFKTSNKGGKAQAEK